MRRPEKAGALLAAAGGARGVTLAIEQLDVAAASAPDRVRGDPSEARPRSTPSSTTPASRSAAPSRSRRTATSGRSSRPTSSGCMAVTRAVLPAMRGRGARPHRQRLEPLRARRPPRRERLRGHEARRRGLQRGAALGGRPVRRPCLPRRARHLQDRNFLRKPAARRPRLARRLLRRDDQGDRADRPEGRRQARRRPPRSRRRSSASSTTHRRLSRTLVGRDARALVALRRVIPDRLFATGIRRLVSAPRSR